ncbi:MAG TPA: nuclear transport factor 2 family protein [Chryseolinea sp.]|nr:nuclear transport factor 2 family protein [Chryseolinea sp.]
METLETTKTTDIAKRLVDYCRKGDWNGAQQELYSKDAVSIEPMATPEFEKETRGLDAITAKGKKYDSIIEKIHKITVSEPLVAGDSIAFVLGFDVTMKGQGRTNSPELCVYHVKDGKIVSEQFFM